MARNGGQARTGAFALLFMLPGVGHCFASDPQYKTPSTIDLLTALENWVEHDQAPASIVAAHVVPKLQRRGLFRKEYEGSTLRENLGLPARPFALAAPQASWG